MNFLRPRHLALIGLATALFGISISTVPVLAAAGFEESAGQLQVSGEASLAIDGLVPGGRSSTRSLEVRAGTAIEYAVRIDWEGSAALAEQLEISMTDGDGAAVYTGPLSGAAGFVSGEMGRLAAGEVDEIAFSAHLPLTAGNEVQGAALTIHVVVEAIGADA